MKNLNARGRFFKPGLMVLFLLIFNVMQVLAFNVESLNEDEKVEVQSTISGNVVDAIGTPIPGVNVLEKNTVNGVVTDFDGNFSISASSTEVILVFSYMGFITKEVIVDGQNNLNIILEEDVSKLDEVVVVGYGTQRKKDLTGSITRVAMDDVNQPSIASFDQMLQGKVAGVQISQTSGAPGGNVNILVRGMSSITGGNEPLYVIDGFPVGSSGNSDFGSYGGNLYSSAGIANNTQQRINPLGSINPSDIESIEILKDASATAIYGSRGANGVVIITTKRGKAGKSEISAEVSLGMQSIGHKLDMLNSQQYAEYVAQGRDNAHVFAGGSASDPNELRAGSRQVRPEFRNPSSIATDTDWQDVIYRVAPVRNYQVSFNNGNDKTRFFIAGGYFDQEGIIETSSFKRFNVRTNIDSNISDKIKIGTSLTGSYSYGRFPNSEGHYGTGGLIMAALAASPTIPVYDDAGQPYFNQADVTDGLGWLANPLDLLSGFSDKRRTANILWNNYLEYKLLDGLTFKTSIGLNYTAGQIDIWRSSKIPNFTTLNYPANAGANRTNSINWLNENTLNYKKSFDDKHFFDVLGGFTVQKDRFERLSVGASDFPTENVPYISAGIVNAGGQIISEWSLLSFMGRLNYSYDSKYLLTATVRKDGSSRFGGNNKWGAFPSVSAGYNISEEDFMDSVNFINNLKLRVSYGISGNNQIGNYNHIGLLAQSNYVANGNQVPGLVPSTLSNDNLTWEKSKQTNIGLDLGMFDNRISINVDAYKDLKTDLLLAVQLPSATGFQSATQNIGDIENKGIEFGLNTVNVQAGDFSWTSSATFSANQNKVLKLATENGRISNNAYQITEVGESISSFYMLNAIGVFANAAEVQGAALQHPETQAGDLRFEDVNNDGTIDSDDRKIVGSPFPDFTWGFDNRFTYKNLSLGISLVGSQGASTYFQGGSSVLNSAGVQNQIADISLGRWVSETQPGNGFQPRAIRSNYANGFGTSSHFLFDSSFTRIKNVNLSYDFPSNATKAIGLSKLALYADVANLFTFTDYPGYDPESSTSGSNVASSGIDYFTYPLARTITVGLKLSF
ncbi:TonB-dependent receptor [Aurantibacter crassamenti]|uniref:SusC/RagA family TonB-linked outer membrane protein n=1 Tax=Aurantibacter crassamenti TaxID=1837375 RepID=UPI0019394F40|nr:TonB-dependent receptor [Aurantibacter crassamenti]MBM1106256.1 TonB-dependent receptor [Aurantibacter crassamenti]